MPFGGHRVFLMENMMRSKVWHGDAPRCPLEAPEGTHQELRTLNLACTFVSLAPRPTGLAPDGIASLMQCLVVHVMGAKGWAHPAVRGL